MDDEHDPEDDLRAGGDEYDQYEDGAGRFHEYVPVSFEKRRRDEAIPKNWTQCTEVPGTGNSIHIMDPNNYVYVKKEAGIKRGKNHCGMIYRCQENRRGDRSCPAQWTVPFHPNEVYERGVHKEVLYTPDNIPSPANHNHEPDVNNTFKRDVLRRARERAVSTPLFAQELWAEIQELSQVLVHKHTTRD